MKEKFGVAPDQVVDVLALMGDTIDNIKGVPGIGEKGARELIAQYGSLENLLAHAAEVKHKRYREGLLANIDDARQSRELARIRTDVPVEFDAEALRYRGGSRERCFEIFNELGFRALVKEYAPTAEHDRQDLPDRQHRRRACRRWPSGCGRPDASRCGCCPTAPTAMRASIVGLAFSTAPRDGDYVPDRASRARRHREPAARRRARGAAAGARGRGDRKDGHDLKFDAIVLARHGVTLRGLDIDTMLASYLLDATRSAHPLEDLALEHTSYKALTEEDVCGRGAKAMSLADVPVDAAVDLRRRARRSGRAAGAACCASCSPRSSSTRSTARSSCR